MLRRCCVFVAALALGACAGTQTQLYDWGTYEEQIYTSYAKPGAGDAQSQVTALEADYQQARSYDRRMPPGWHAHLGYLYFQLGKVDEARQQFVTEKAQFPESGVFMDRLLARLKKS